MEKNTLWAIVLSTIVLVGFMMAQSLMYPNRGQQRATTATTADNVESIVASDAAETDAGVLTAVVSADAATADGAEASDGEAVPELAEQTYIITTNKVKVTFTNRGGDVIGYELLDHKDAETGRGVEMADNISAMNRAFSLSFGGATNAIIDDVFTARVIDDYTIGFFKTFRLAGASEFTLVKTYSFKADDYVFKLDIAIDGGDGFTGLNLGDAAYTLRTSPQIGPHFDRKTDRYEYRNFISYNGEKAKKFPLVTNQYKTNERYWSWTGLCGKYFIILTSPLNAAVMSPQVAYSSQVEVGGYENAQLRMTRLPISAQKQTDSYYIYVGPRNEKELVKYNVAEKNEWALAGKKFNESLQTSGLFNWIEIVLKFIMELLYKVIPNWGVSIIIMTALLKLAMFPITKKSAMGTQKMQQISPRMQEIQAKYKDNPQKMQLETAKLYKEIGYNPMAGCLPLILQFIILIAMYNLFNNYFEFRGASFIPGWIDDLSRGDHIGGALKFEIPLLRWNYIRILPVIYVISQLLFGKITQNGGTTASANQSQMRWMMYGMPLIFFFIFYNAPAGLLLYWTVSNIIQLVQQLVINKMMRGKSAAQTASAVRQAKVLPPKAKAKKRK